MRESKLPKKTEQERENFVSGYSVPCKDQEGETSPNAKPLRVRFVVPEGTVLEPADTGTTSKELITLPTLPSICEFAMFSSNRTASKPGKQVSSTRPLTKLPPMYTSKSKIDGATDSQATYKKALTGKGPVTCTKQDIRMEIKGKLPEDYRDPTYKETKKRIWDWLRQSEEHQPAYLRRAHALRETVNLDKNDTQYQTFSQQKSLTQRIGL